MIQTADILSHLWEWASQTSGETTIWAHERGPVPEYPFVLLRVISGPTALAPLGSVTETLLEGSEPGEEIEVASHVPVELTLSVQVQSRRKDNEAFDASKTSLHIASKLQGSLRTSAARKTLRDGGLVVVGSGGVQDLTELAADRFVGRHAFDVRLRTRDVVADPHTFIEAVEYAADLRDHEGVVRIIEETIP